MNGDIERSARMSECGSFRWTLTRRWDDRPMLLVVMFNPSTADHMDDDNTIRTLMQRASRVWGFGGIEVVNLIPLRSSSPDDAVEYANRDDWHARDKLQLNVGVIIDRIKESGAILLAYGALGNRVPEWTEFVIEEIDCAVTTQPIYCMAKTAGGYPTHPMARGKHRVPNDAPLVPWRTP